MLSSVTEQQLLEWLEQFGSFGPLPGILLTFLKSFVPPLPTLLIVSVNAAAYGLWLGFLYSWIGMLAGCVLTFALVRGVAGHRLLERWTSKPKVQEAMLWARRNAFSYVFLLSLLPVGPFVVVNIAAALSGMRLRSFALAAACGKGIMILFVSYIGHDWTSYMENPLRLLYIVLFIAVSLVISKNIERRFSQLSAGPASENNEDEAVQR